MTAVVHTLPPLRSSAAHLPRLKVKPRDLVTWTNPNTGEVWSDLVVEFVYPRTGTALCRGWFGRIARKSGDCHIESRPVSLAHLVVTGNAAEVAS